jgi:hypothetical protein
VDDERRAALRGGSSGPCQVQIGLPDVTPASVPATIVARPTVVSIGGPITEEIVAQWHGKPKGGLRLIRSEGPRRTARRLIIRDMLGVMQVDSEFDYSRKGVGSERAFVSQVCKSIDGGLRWWWTPDIKTISRSRDQAILNGCRLRRGWW